MQKDSTKESSDDTLAVSPKFWQRLTGKGNGGGLSTPVKVTLYFGGFVLLMVVVLVLYAKVPVDAETGEALESWAVIDYPEDWTFGWDVIKFIDGIVSWVVEKGDALFSAINHIVLHGLGDYLDSLGLWIPGWMIILIFALIAGGLTWRIASLTIAGTTVIFLVAICFLGLVPLEDYFLWLPWWSIILITGVLAWQTVNIKFAAIAAGFLIVMSLMGLLDLGSQTLAITLTSTVICVVFGLPLGILAAKNNRVDGVIRPILDMMQTMPSFVYLIPAVMLFSLGKTPAVMATCIYAIPPIIRLTNLGIREVDAQVVEAAESFGTTPWQLLSKVQAPMALPTILAGLNQTVMMALAMVVIASMIGAKGLGSEVLLGINRLQVGRGFLGGISIVFMAIILDRISQGFARRPGNRRAV